MAQIYTFSFDPDWMHLLNEISIIDRFDASWSAIEKREGATLRQLRSIATVKSTGASTRIEGSRMTDAEVEALVKDLSIATLEDRDHQEVAGYFETLELIADSYLDIDITEGNLLNLHKQLMRYNEADAWHRGGYKQLTNAVERINVDGSKQTIFQTTGPGMATEDAMRELLEWYHKDTKTLKLIKIALFVYEFLSIHSFQDGNGRLSRLLGTLLLLKNNYTWVQYISFEHEIEARKPEYYKVLMECQRNRPGEEVYPWVLFFIDCLKSIQEKLSQKLEVKKKAERLAPREQMVYAFIENHPGVRSSEIADRLSIPLPSTKRLLSQMVQRKLIQSNGAGSAVHYYILGNAIIKKNQTVLFQGKERKKTFLLKNESNFLEIHRIVLSPHFHWSHPDQWGSKLSASLLSLSITCTMNTGTQVKTPAFYLLPNPYQYEPVFELATPIQIPDTINEQMPFKKDYPIQVTLELVGAEHIEFDVLVVYNEA